MRPSTRTSIVGVAVVVVLLAVGGALLATRDTGSGGSSASTSSTTSTRPGLVGSPGGRGVGDPYFPDLGNGGYDVEHYDLALAWQADAGVLEGVATITATATQDLSQFDLDLSGMEVRFVEVDGAPAAQVRDGAELVITPGAPLPDGGSFTTVVGYGGVPKPIHQGTDLFEVGWQTDGREAFVASEPAGAATFFPGNDHPSDKATYAFHVTAPADQVVATNGLSTGRATNADGTITWESAARDPIASYLVQVAIGDYEIVDGGTSAAGVPIRHALHRTLSGAARPTLARTPQMMDVMAEIWGPYPFEVYGVVAVDEDLGFALETQTLTLLGSGSVRAGTAAEDLLVHELAHQWVGDSVSVSTWKDIWLNEGFATYSEWLWSERSGGPSAGEIARRASRAGLRGTPGDPGPDELFQDIVYARGALLLQALRESIGDPAFFQVLRRWTDEHRGASVATADFVALAEEVSGRELDPLFQRWLYEPALPALG